MQVALYPTQLRLIQSPEREVLVSGKGGGKSHALRSGGILFALQSPGLRIALLHSRHDEISATHIEGRRGLKALLTDAPGGAAFSDGKVVFGNGSQIAWFSADRPHEVRQLLDFDPRLVLIDDLHRVPKELYEQIALRLEIAGGRILAASSELAASGWVAERFGVAAAARSTIQTSVADLPLELQAATTEPTLEQHMDSLGIPFFAAGSRFRESPYIKKVIDVLQRWYWQEFQILYVLMPTQLGKTTCGVEVMTSYILRNRPYETVGLSCCSATSARDRSITARKYFLKSGGQLAAGMEKAEYWKTPDNGGCWAVSLYHGTGKPASWLIDDDPDEDMEDSKSEASIRKKDNDFRMVWMGRESKHAAKEDLSLLTVATRFWARDTVRRTIDYHVEREEKIRILALPAFYDPLVADHYEGIAPGLITVEKDFREENGQVIWDEKKLAQMWRRTRDADPVTHNSRDQQKPYDAAGGSKFDESHVVDIWVDPAFKEATKGELETYRKGCRGWDFAATEGAGNWTASTKMGELKEVERWVARHATRLRVGPRGVLRLVAAMMLLDGEHVAVVIPDDPAAGGKQQTDRVVQYLKDVCRRLTVPCQDCAGPRCSRCSGEGQFRFRRPRIRVVPVQGMEDSFGAFADRAHPVSDTIEGQVDYVRAEWRPRLTESLPWFWRAVELADGDWKEELREIEKISREAVEAGARWWVEWLRELHQFPNAKPDDWTCSVAYAWQYVSGAKSVYPSAPEDP